MYIIAWVILYAATLDRITSASVTDESDANGIVWRWTGFMVSRSGIYLILVTVILMNFFYTLLRNKLENYEINNSVDQFKKNTSTSAIRHLDTSLGFLENTQSDGDTESIRNRLREAEATVIALKIELEETLKAKIDFENSIEELERDRSFSEDELIKIKIASSVEMDKLKKENSALRCQLGRAKNDKEELSKVIEVLQREARITEAALRDQQSLNQHLEVTRKELEKAKTELKGTKIERDAAVRLASEQIYKMTSDRSTYKRDLIEEMIDVELRKMREEEEGATDIGVEMTDKTIGPTTITFNLGTDRDVRRRTFATTGPMVADIGQEVTTRNSDFANANGFLPQAHMYALGDGPSPCICPVDDTYNLDTENSVYSNPDRTESTSENDDERSDGNESDSEDANGRIVSNSPAFRAFLENTFGL